MTVRYLQGAGHPHDQDHSHLAEVGDVAEGQQGRAEDEDQGAARGQNSVTMVGEQCTNV